MDDVARDVGEEQVAVRVPDGSLGEVKPVRDKLDQRSLRDEFPECVSSPVGAVCGLSVQPPQIPLVSPPSTTSAVPVTQPASSEAR